jgi:hypothetical protein
MYERDSLEIHGGIPLTPAEAFTLQRDSGDEQPYHSHDQASRERDASAALSFATCRDECRAPRHMTNTPRAGETPQHVAVRYRTDVPKGAKDCKEFCGDACRCGLRVAGEIPSKGRIPFKSKPLMNDPDPEATMRNAIEQLAEGFKENNPKDAFGVLKACMSWVPLPVIMELCLAMAEGGFKYGGHNYMVAAPRATVYTDGAFRHIYQFKYEGDLDHESKVGLHHISKAIASLVVLRAAQINNHWVDDRPPRAPEGFLADCNAKMVELAKALPEPVARYLADGKRGPGRILES